MRYFLMIKDSIHLKGEFYGIGENGVTLDFGGSYWSYYYSQVTGYHLIEGVEQLY